MNSQLSLVLAAPLLLFASTAAHAESLDELKSKTFTIKNYGDASKAKLYEYDTSVPAAPALSMVEKAPELSFGSPFGPDLSKEVVLTGDKAGAAFAARPYWVLTPPEDTPRPSTYAKKGRWTNRVLARSGVSGAVAPRVTEEAKGLGGALGFHTEFLDSADPRMNDAHLSCLGTEAEAVNVSYMEEWNQLNSDPAILAEAKAFALALVDQRKVPEVSRAGIQGATNLRGIQAQLPAGDGYTAFHDWQRDRLKAVGEQAEAKLKLGVARCFKRAKIAAENSSSFQVAAGAGWASRDYDFSDVKSTGVQGWAAYRIPLGRSGACRSRSVTMDMVVLEADDASSRAVSCLPPLGNLTAFAHYVTDDKVTTGGAEQDARTTQVGAVLAHKAASNNWSVSASAVWNRRNYDLAALSDEEFERYSLSFAVKTGLEIPAAGKLWLEATFGQTSGIATAKEESFGLVRLTFK